jgi:hypothetical protein
MQERSPARRVRIVEVSVLAIVIVLVEDFFTISPIKQFICHSQRDNVIEFRALRIGAEIKNFATIQRYGYHCVLNVMRNQ